MTPIMIFGLLLSLTSAHGEDCDSTIVKIFSGEEARLINQHEGGMFVRWYNTYFDQPKEEPDDEHKVAIWDVENKGYTFREHGYDLDNKTGDLLIPRATSGVQGCYTAYLVHFDGNKFDYVKLIVYVAPTGVFIQGLSGPVNETTRNITCTVPKVNPANVSFTWCLTGHGDIGSDIKPPAEIDNDNGTWKVISTLEYKFHRDDNGSTLVCDVAHGVDSTIKVSARKTVIVHYPYEMTTKAKNTYGHPIRGKNWTLTCEPKETGYPEGDQYFWYKDGEFGQPLEDGDKYAGVKTPQVTIQKLVVDDDGDYECKLLNSGGMSKTDQSYNLTVLYKPEINVTGPEVVKEYTFVLLKCRVVEAKPNITLMKWYCNGTETNEIGPSYEIDNVTRKDTGTYECVAQNRVGPSSAKFKMDVYYLYKAITEEENNRTIRGENKTLFCNVSDVGNPHSETYLWYMNGTKLDTTEKHTGTDLDRMTIHHLTESDIGRYDCVITNAAGNSTRDKPYYLKDIFHAPLIKKVCPSDVIEYKEAVFICTVDANPKVEKVKWFHNGEIINEAKNETYSIDKVERTQKGNYSCSVANDFGNDADWCLLDVLYGPAGLPKLSVDKHAVAIGHDVIFECGIDGLDVGNPPATEFVWKKDSEIIKKEMNSTYSFTTHVVTDSAKYSCALKNEYNMTEFAVQKLKVEAPVQIEGNAQDIYKPLFNDSSFSVEYNVSGTSVERFVLEHFSINVTNTAFRLETKIISGDFSYGQNKAVNVKWTWNLKEGPYTCDNVTSFNGNYSFEAEGQLVGEPSVEESTFTLTVQYPALWNNSTKRESSALEVPKSLHCDVCAEPAPSEFIWTFMGTILTNASERILNIGNVTSEDFGLYTCTAINIIEDRVYNKTYNITLEEKGSPHSPTSFVAKSRTSKTLLVKWQVGFNGGYPLKKFEIYVDDDDLIEIKDCLDNVKICEYRIEKLQPDTKYRIRLRAENMREDGNSFSDCAETNEWTKPLPEVKFLKPAITEDHIKVTWLYSEDRRYNLLSDDDDIGVAVKYKEESESEEDFKRCPKDEDEKIAATCQGVEINGTFKPTLTYNIMYFIYEGNEISNKSVYKTEPSELVIDPSNAGLIAGLVVGGVLLIVLVSVFVVVWIRQGKTKGPSAPHDVDNNFVHSTQDLVSETGFGGIEHEYAEVTMRKIDQGGRPLSGPKPAIAPKPTSRTSNLENHAYVNVAMEYSDTEQEPGTSGTGAHGGDTGEAQYAEVRKSGLKPKKPPKPKRGDRPKEKPKAEVPALTYVDITFDDDDGTTPKQRPNRSQEEPVLYADINIDDDAAEEPKDKRKDNEQQPEGEDNPGLLYADLEFGKKKVNKRGPEMVRGAENQVDYADLDYFRMKKSAQKAGKTPPTEKQEPESMYCNVNEGGSLV